MPENNGFISQLQKRLQSPLPGLPAQLKMAPSIRAKNVVVPNDARTSAILLLLYPENGQFFIPFMRRAEDGRVHGGQGEFSWWKYRPG